LSLRLGIVYLLFGKYKGLCNGDFVIFGLDLPLRTSFFKHDHLKKVAEQIERLELAIMFEINDYFTLSEQLKAFKDVQEQNSHWNHNYAHNVVILNRILCQNASVHFSLTKLTYPTLNISQAVI